MPLVCSPLLPPSFAQPASTKLVADFSLDTDIFSSQEDDCEPSALLGSPIALHLSPPVVDARPRAPSAEINLETFTSSFEAELDALMAQRQQQKVAVAMEAEHPAKRLR